MAESEYLPVYASVDDIMNGVTTFRGGEILADAERTILAVDTLRSWGAAFDFAVHANGEWSAEGIRAVRTAAGRWEEIGVEGSWGDGWPSPWTPPDEGWDGRHLLPMGTVGQDVSDDDHDTELLAVYGFVSTHARLIRVEKDGGATRTIAPSPCGAFIALSIGSGDLSLTPLAHDGRPLLSTESFGTEDTRNRVLTVDLAELDAGLAERLTARLVDRFLVGGGLNTSHRAEAMEQTRIDAGLTRYGAPCELDFKLPLGSGNPCGHVWDGSERQAEQIVDVAADGGIDDVLWDQQHIGPTGWEAEP
jgi:hypothetical protein